MYYKYRERSTPHKTRSRIDFYNTVTSGDILLLTSQTERTIFFNWFRCFNYGMCHAAVIIEENGIKYISHAHPKNFVYQKQHVKYKSKSCLYGDWIIIKEPFFDFLYQNRNDFVYIIYRHPIQRPIYVSVIPFLLRKLNVFYCSMYTGDLLSINKCIPSSTISFPYRTDHLLEVLDKNGYQQSLTFLCT